MSLLTALRAPSARWQKVLADIFGNKTRSLLVVLSIAIGVFAIGMVAGARNAILLGLQDSHAAGRFAHATFTTVRPFDETMLRRVRAVPGVKAAEGRRVVGARLALAGSGGGEGDGSWGDMWLFGVPSFDRIGISKIWPMQGAWPPPERELVLERNSLSYVGARVGQDVRLELPHGKQQTFRVAGTAHDLSPPATAVSGIVYGYVTFGTLEWLGLPNGLTDMNQVHLLVTENEHDREHILRVAAAVRSAMEAEGWPVALTNVPEPGKFWANDHVQSMLMLLGLLGAVCLFMSGFLVVNIIAALLAQQTRQIGVMKSIGASAREMSEMYLTTVLSFGVLALAAGIPIGIAGSLGLVYTSLQKLNFDASGLGLGPDVLALQMGAGLIVPLLAAVVPVIAGSRITVKDAIASYGLGQGEEHGMLSRAVEKLSFLSPAVSLSLRNTFRRKGRLLLTLATLVLGGALFMGVLSVRSSVMRTLDDAGRYRNYDVQLTFEQPYPAAALEREAKQIAGVARVESWAIAGAHLVAAGRPGETLTAIGAPAGSEQIQPVVLEGRWLESSDNRAVVVNSDVLKTERAIEVGKDVRLRINGREESWRVVGVVRGALAGPIVYANYGPLTDATGQPDLAGRLHVVTVEHDAGTQRRVGRAVEERLKRAGYLVGSVQTTADKRVLDESNFGVIVNFLMAMALLVGVVGGLGLMGTMGINVLERTREIGVLRAIGAGDGDVRQLVMTEAILIGLIGWALAAPLALPVSRILSDAVGALFIHAPLNYVFSTGSAAIWFVITLGIAVAASLGPAYNASRLTIRDVLAYE